MATIRFVLKKIGGKPRINKGGTVSIYTKYTHHEKHITLSTGVRILPEQWAGEENQQYPVKGAGRTTKNDLISQARQKVEKAIAELQYAGKDPTIQAVKSLLKKETKLETPEVLRLFDDYIAYS